MLSAFENAALEINDFSDINNVGDKLIENLVMNQ